MRGSCLLGQIAIQGELGLLKIPYDWLVRLRHNPFYEYLESRTVAWMKRAGENQSAVGEWFEDMSLITTGGKQ